MMWSDLPFGVLAYIFSFLSPDSLACTKSVCRNWHEAAKYLVPSEIRHHNRPAWFLAYPIRNPDNFWYAYTPVDKNWYTLPLDFIPNRSIDSVRSPIRPISAVGGLIILKLTTTAALQLAVCNPFTRLFKLLPELNIRRKNPAVGVELCKSSAADAKFKIYVAGGMSDTATSGASYEPTVEMYDSSSDKWEIIGDMQMEIAVRLTVWTPNESVCSNGVLYWMTSARVYSVMGFEIRTKEWRELSVPMGGERMEFGALVPRKGKLCFVGGKCGGDGCIWEMGEEEGGKWRMVERVPHELGMRFLGGKGCWDGTKCVGIEGVMCLYRNLGEGSGMLIWKEEEEDKKKYEWKWIDECCSLRGKQLQNLQIKGLLLHPNLALTS